MFRIDGSGKLNAASARRWRPTVDSADPLIVLPFNDPGPPPSCPLPDTFDGAALGSCWDGGALSGIPGTPTVSGGLASGNGVSARWLTALDAGAQWAEIVIPARPSDYVVIGVMFLDGATENGFEVSYKQEPGGGQILFIRLDGGAGTQLGNQFISTPSFPLTFRVERTTGGVFTPYINTVAQSTYTNTTYTPTHAGFLIDNGSGDITSFDASATSGGGGSAVDLVATAISHSLAFGIVPVARALRAAAIGLSLASNATRVARDLKAAAVSASRASDVTVVGRTLRASGISLTSARAPLPVARALTARALDADQALAVSLVARALRASGLSIDSATGALPVGRSLSAAALSGSVVVSVLPVGRGLRASAIDFDLAVLLALDISGVLPVLLVATAISYSRAVAVVPVSRALLATDVSQSLAAGAVPVARALAARSISSGRASGVSVALRALRASALSLSPAASASRSLRSLRAAGLSLGRAVAALPVARPLTARAVSLSRAGSVIPIVRGLRASGLSGSRGLAALPVARGLRASALSLGRANGSAHVARLLRASALSPDLAAAVAPVARALEAHAIGFDLALLGDLIVISGESWIVPICRVTLLSPSATVEQLLPIGRVSLEDLPTAELSLALAPVANVDHAEPGALITLEDLPMGAVCLQSPGATVTHEDPIATITRRTS